MVSFEMCTLDLILLGWVNEKYKLKAHSNHEEYEILLGYGL
jgi:hypothetical protein